MLIVQVDVVDAEAGERGIARGPARTPAGRFWPMNLPVGSPATLPKFRRQDDSLTLPLDRLPDEDLVRKGP